MCIPGSRKQHLGQTGGAGVEILEVLTMQARPTIVESAAYASTGAKPDTTDPTNTFLGVENAKLDVHNSSIAAV